MKKREILAAVLAAVMSVTVLPELSPFPSFSITASAASKLAAPKSISYSATENSITLKWNKVSGADAYRVFMFDSDTDEYEKYKDVTKTSCKVSELSAGKTYKFKVAALVKKSGKYVLQTKSDKITTKTESAEKLAAPTGLKASASETKIKLTWNAVDGADAYNVYKYNSSSDEYKKHKRVSGTSCNVKNLKSGTKYKFKVAAVVENDGSYVAQTKSKVVSATTKSSMRTEPAEFKYPASGAKKSTVLRDCGIANYEYDSKDGWYSGEAIYLGVVSNVYLRFSDDGAINYVGVFTPLSYSKYTIWRDAHKDTFGTDYTLTTDEYGDLQYEWIGSDIIYSLKYISRSKKVYTFVAYRSTYAAEQNV